MRIFVRVRVRVAEGPIAAAATAPAPLRQDQAFRLRTHTVFIEAVSTISSSPWKGNERNETNQLKVSVW
jgi:hypothetical protein